jgi:3-oxoadipate enol-lactonase
LWGPCLPLLIEAFDVLAWDLPGHGRSPSAAADFTMAQLADGVLDAVDAALEAGGEPVALHYAGDSIGGAVGLHLLLDHPGRLVAASLLCTGARIGEPRSWLDRAGMVERSGVGSVVDGSRQRWFGPGFPDRHPDRADALIASLRAADPADYARACRALASFDVRDRLPGIGAPVLAVAGSHDQPTPVASLREIADGVVNGRLEVLDGVAHLAPAEAPDAVAALLRDHHGQRTRPPSNGR